MKVVAIVGSLRKDSYNRKIAEFIKDNFKEKLEVEVVRLNDLPMFNEDIEKDPPQAVKDLNGKIKSADGVLFVTPEYNHSIPGVLKNAIDWCSRGERPLSNKPTFIVGASDGNVGTARCQGDLRKVLNGPGVATLNLPGNLVVIGNVDQKFNESGEFTDERTIKRLGSVIDNFIEWVEKVK